MGIRFLEDRNDQITDLDLLFLGVLRVVKGMLNHSVKRQGLHRLDRIVSRHALEVVVEEPLDLDPQSLDIGA